MCAWSLLPGKATSHLQIVANEPDTLIGSTQIAFACSGQPLADSRFRTVFGGYDFNSILTNQRLNEHLAIRSASDRLRVDSQRSHKIHHIPQVTIPIDRTPAEKISKYGCMRVSGRLAVVLEITSAQPEAVRVSARRVERHEGPRDNVCRYQAENVVR